MSCSKSDMFLLLLLLLLVFLRIIRVLMVSCKWSGLVCFMRTKRTGRIYIYIYIYKTLAFEGNENLNFIDWIDLMLHFMWRVGWVHCQYKQIMKIIFNSHDFIWQISKNICTWMGFTFKLTHVFIFHTK